MDPGTGEGGGGGEDPVALALKHRGIDPDDRFDPYFELWMYQRPLEEERFRAWMSCPLNLHDGGLVEAERSIIKWGVGLSGRYVDLTREIDGIVELHPGPTTSFRIDSSAFPGAHLLNRWIDLLSAREVQELILLNLTGPEDTEPPLHKLRSHRLSYLGVGFIDMRSSLDLAMMAADLDGHPWWSLNHLAFTACIFSGNDLSKTIRSLQVLKTVTIRSCALTEHCITINLCFSSPSLVALHLYDCTAHCKVTVQSTPTLKDLTLGVVAALKVAKTATPPPLQVEILFCGNLKSVKGLDLQNQIVTLNSRHRMKVNRATVMILPNVHFLEVAVKMSTTNHVLTLLTLLSWLPTLKNLVLECVDDTTSTDACPGLDSARCLTNALEHLTMKRFRGGHIETSFVLQVLDIASSFKTLTVEPPEPTTPQEATKSVQPKPTVPLQFHEAIALFRRKAKRCEVLVVPPVTDRI